MSARPEPCIRIDGEIVETDSVTTGLPESAPSFHRIDLQISVQTVLHELQECGVEVSEQTLADFLKQDAQDDRGRDAYLLMASVVGARHARDGAGLRIGAFRFVME